MSHTRGGSRKIGKNMIFWRKIVIFHTKYPQQFSRLPPQLKKKWFFGVKSWFFTRNIPKIFAPPSARRNFFKCAPPPNLKSWVRFCIHVIELLCYNWRFGLITGDFLSTYLMRVFIVYWCFPFVCFSIEPTASHFNIYCLHFSVLSSVSYVEWRIKTVFIIYS